MGNVYRVPKSPFWWCHYSIKGKQYRMSTKTGNKKEAEKFLAKQVAQEVVPDIVPSFGVRGSM